MADTENRGFLLQEDFAKAMRLIGQYQANQGIALRPELALSRTSLFPVVMLAETKKVLQPGLCLNLTA